MLGRLNYEQWKEKNLQLLWKVEVIFSSPVSSVFLDNYAFAKQNKVSDG